MAIWLYAASAAKASAVETLSLACDTGFIWRPFYRRDGTSIPGVRQIQPGDTLLLGYRTGPSVKLLARFRAGRPDHPISASPVFSAIPASLREDFHKHGYTADPVENDLVGIFVEQWEPLGGQVEYTGRNTLVLLDSDYRVHSTPARPTRPGPNVLNMEGDGVRPSGSHRQQISSSDSEQLAVRNGVHIGVDVGGRADKGYDLCIAEWAAGMLDSVQWISLPHSSPLPPTSSLRGFVRVGDIAALASASYESASATAASLWRTIEKFDPAGVHIDSPSAFSRNLYGHGRYCEKRSLRGVFFQSTPSIACNREHGGDWGWLVYGMIAFSALLHRGDLSITHWVEDLSLGTCARFDSNGIVVRECFPTATVSVLRERNRSQDVVRTLAKLSSLPAVEAVTGYLTDGVAAVKRRGQRLYDCADALVAALGALPHVAPEFREATDVGMHGENWAGGADDQQIEGAFVCVE